ncbi:hypothetical protein V5799_027531 [Amblyomma americanum]|uniref:Uncharacterized protein n=1 Tax=Amblyomma americanum TaxID=6943 RepID=A0AAQ4DFG2_AMBAM
MTPSRTSRKKEGAPSSPEFNFEEYLETRRRGASAQVVPALPDGGRPECKASSGVPPEGPLVEPTDNASARTEPATQAGARMRMQHWQGGLKQEETSGSSHVTDAPAGHGPEQIGPGPESALLPSREVATTAAVMEHANGGRQGVPGVLSDAPSHVILMDDAEA